MKIFGEFLKIFENLMVDLNLLTMNIFLEENLMEVLNLLTTNCWAPIDGSS